MERSNKMRMKMLLQRLIKTRKKKNQKDGLAELLGVTPDVNLSEGPETDSAQQKQRAVRLIQASVSQHLPKPPSDLDQNLQQHLVNVQETVRHEVMRLSPRLKKMGLIGCLIDCYHRQTFDQISDLFKKVQSSQKSFVLMKWILHIYIVVAPIEKGDFLLLTELVAKAKNLLLENVQKEVSKDLDNILLFDRNQDVCDSVEYWIGLYKDIIQHINGIPIEAISPKLSHEVREVCFLELKMFLGRYTSGQTEILEAKKAMENQIHFFKTMKTCKEIKEYVQTKSEGIKNSLIQEIVATLENMEDVTLKLLMEIVADMAESLFQNYFKTEHNQWVLMSGLTTHFSELLWWCQDEQRRVMDEAYQLIAFTYLKHLVRSSQMKLRKCWGRDFVQKVKEDAESLHNSISNLAPDVQQWNLMLLKIPELLDCNDINAVKLTVAIIQSKCPTWSEDEEVLSALLEWKGLCKWKISEVLDALPGHEPTHTDPCYTTSGLCTERKGYKKF